MTASRRAGAAMVAALVAVTLGGSLLVSRSAGQQFADLSYAPPMRPHLFDDTGKWQGPFFYPAAPGEPARASICGRPQPADSARLDRQHGSDACGLKTSAGHGCRLAPTPSDATSSLVFSSARG